MGITVRSFKLFFFLHGGQGVVKQAVLYADRACLSGPSCSKLTTSLVNVS